MKYIELLKIKEKLTKITAEPLKNVPVNARKDLFFLTKKVNEYIEFYSNEQLRFAKMFGKLQDNGTVMFEGETKEEKETNAQPFITAMTELNETEIEIEKVSIGCENLTEISVDDMIVLSPIIDFFSL